MDSADQALAVAIQLLQNTQMLVLKYQVEQLQYAPAGHLQDAPFLRMPAQVLEQLDPELQDTCDSLQASSIASSSSSMSFSR